MCHGVTFEPPSSPQCRDDVPLHPLQASLSANLAFAPIRPRLTQIVCAAYRSQSRLSSVVRDCQSFLTRRPQGLMHPGNIELTATKPGFASTGTLLTPSRGRSSRGISCIASHVSWSKCRSYLASQVEVRKGLLRIHIQRYPLWARHAKYQLNIIININQEKYYQESGVDE